MGRSLRLRVRRRGAAAIEFALTMVIFFMLLFTIVDWSWTVFDQMTIERAVADSIRAGALSSTPADTARSTMLTRLGATRFDVHSSTVFASEVGSSPMRQVILEVEVPYTPLAPFPGVPFPNKLVSSAAMHVENQ